MKKIFLILFSIIATFSFAQDAATLYETGRKFLVQGDYDNAVLVLKRASNMAPDNLQYQTDLANAYYYKNDFDNAKVVIEKVIENDNADEQAFYTACNISKAKSEMKSAEKYLKKGIKKFEKSGLLYNAFGELLWQQRDYTAIKQWEKGIQVNPNFSSNYYNATLYYYLTKEVSDKIWAAYYGEIFINLESYSVRTVEVKGIILDSYKRIFQDEKYLNSKSKNDFEDAFKTSLNKQNNIAYNGINTANLIMIRTQFILDWFYIKNNINSTLFNKQQQLLREGMFEAYNYWIFETIQNAGSYENWVNTHNAENEQFAKFQQNKIFKIPEGEYYK